MIPDSFRWSGALPFDNESGQSWRHPVLLNSRKTKTPSISTSLFQVEEPDPKLECGDAAFLIANPNRLIHLGNKNLSVADFAR